jgi:hypothetical protein
MNPAIPNKMYHASAGALAVAPSPALSQAVNNHSRPGIQRIPSANQIGTINPNAIPQQVGGQQMAAPMASATQQYQQQPISGFMPMPRQQMVPQIGNVGPNFHPQQQVGGMTPQAPSMQAPMPSPLPTNMVPYNGRR